MDNHLMKQLQRVRTLDYAKITGIGLGLLAMVFFGLYMIPRKESAVCDRTYSLWMGVGILLSTTVTGLLAGGIRHVTFTRYLLMFGSGIVWSTGGFGYAMGVKLIGLFRSTPIKNTAAVLGAFTGVFILHEFPLHDIMPLTLVLLGSVAVLASAVVITRVRSRSEEEMQQTELRTLLLGVFWSFWAAVAFTAYAIPMKIVYEQGVTPIEFLFYMSQGIFAGLVLLALLCGSRSCEGPVTWRDRGWAMLTGLTYALGAICNNIAVYLVGVAVTWPLTRNPVVTVLFGALAYREVDLAKHKAVLGWGLALSVVGIVLITIAAVYR